MPQEGQQYAHFKILRKLGEGGMGQVYLAEDSKLGRKVALKVLPREVSDRPDRHQRFQREAQTAAQISNPNVMSIFDIGATVDPDSGEESKYIVMEYVEGQPLADYLRDKQIDIAGTVRLAEKIASGMAAAHQLNIVHRDIKADNIIVASGGEPKILDFGLAKPVDRIFETDDDDTTKSVDQQDLTRAGKIVGTVSYMSPEQSRGEKIDTRSDIFSFGVLLYRMATGEFPFAGPTSVSTLAKILEARHESPRTKNDAISPELERIIDKCLQKNADDRYQDTRDLVVDLRNLRRLYDSGTGDTISAELDRPSDSDRSIVLKLGWKQYVAAVFVFALIVAAIAYFFERGSAPGTTALQAKSHSLAILGFENKTEDPALDWLETGLPEILLTDLAQSEAISIISRERIIDCLPEAKRTRHTFDECVEAAVSLGAVNLLSGSFYKLGDKIRIDARLQDAASGNIVFGEKVVGEDPFTLVDSLTQKIAAALDISASLAQDRDVATYTSSSPDAFRHYRVGVEKMYAELYDEAIVEFHKALSFDSTFALPYLRIGMSYVFQGMQAEGAAYFARAKEFERKLPVRDQALLDIYSDLWLDRNYDDAFIKMSSFVKRHPDDKEGHAIYAILVNVFAGDTTKAFAHLDTALAIDPTYQLALSQYSLMYDAQDNHEKALEYAQRIKKYHPESPEAYRTIANIYVEQGRLDAAMTEIVALLDLYPENRQAHTRMINLLLKKRDFDAAWKALERFKEVIGDDPHWLRRYYRIRGNLNAWGGQFKAMMADYRKAYEESVRAEDDALIFTELVTLAQNFWRIDMLDSALYYIKASDAYANDLAKSNYPLAVMWDHTLADQLEPLMLSALEGMQKRIPSELWYAIDDLKDIFYSYARGDTAALIELHDKRVKQNQTQVYPHGNDLGRLQILTGQFEDGKENLLKHYATPDALSTAYVYVSSRYYLGIADEGLGNTEEAIRNYEEVLRFWDKADIQIDLIKDARVRLASLTS